MTSWLHKQLFQISGEKGRMAVATEAPWSEWVSALSEQSQAKQVATSPKPVNSVTSQQLTVNFVSMLLEEVQEVGLWKV